MKTLFTLLDDCAEEIAQAEANVSIVLKLKSEVTIRPPEGKFGSIVVSVREGEIVGVEVWLR